MDWILSNPDFDITTEAVQQEEQTSDEQQNKPDVPKVTQTPEERAASAAALQERLNKARELRIAKEKQEKIEKEKERREQVIIVKIEYIYIKVNVIWSMDLCNFEVQIKNDASF